MVMDDRLRPFRAIHSCSFPDVNRNRRGGRCWFGRREERACERPAWENATTSFLKDLASNHVHQEQPCSPSFHNLTSNGITTESRPSLRPLRHSPSVTVQCCSSFQNGSPFGTTARSWLMSASHACSLSWVHRIVGHAGCCALLRFRSRMASMGGCATRAKLVPSLPATR
jgi:hypothetical protein